MAANGAPSAWRVAVDGWRLAIQAAREMPILAGSTIGVAVVVSIVDAWLGRRILLGQFGVLESVVVRVVQVALPQLVFASCAIAVHRFVLLAERFDRYVWQTPPQFWRFFDRLMALQLLFTLPTLMLVVRPPYPSLFVSLGAICSIVAFVVTLRSMLLFPAVAVDARFTGWRNAWHDSSGQEWRLFWAVLCLALPVMLIYFGTIAFGFARYGWQSLFNPITPWGIVQTCIVQTAMVAWVWAAAATASILFRSFGAAQTQPS